MPAASLSTQFGSLSLHEDAGHIVRVTWEFVNNPVDTPLLSKALQQLREYCSGLRTAFDLPLRPSGAPLAQAVCAEMQRIPFGQTRTYGEIATALGVSAQAVGRACGQNPLPILIPCHRVMGADGKLVGFSGAGGVETKVALLRHEGAASLLI